MERISERTVPDTLLAPSRATVVPADSWHGLNPSALAEWIAKEGRLFPPPAPQIARTRRLTGFQIVATGSYAPDAIVSNDDLQATHGFDPQWIAERTGIRQRRHAPAELATSDLCREASRAACERRVWPKRRSIC